MCADSIREEGIAMNEKLYKVMNWRDVEEIVYSESDDPHRLLGAHREGNKLLVQAFFPNVRSVKIRSLDGVKAYPMECVDEAGFYAALIPEKVSFAYEYLVNDGKRERKIKEVYNQAPVITKKDTDKFQAGIHYTVYDILGAHAMTVDGVKGMHFAVWAPGALRVSVVGDFNQWDGRVHQMRRLWDSGIFELFLPDVGVGENYKFEIKVKGGLTYLKADPYAFRGEMRPGTASVTADISGFRWEDDKWIKERGERQSKNAPMSIYELYLGSFKRAAVQAAPEADTAQEAPETDAAQEVQEAQAVPEADTPQQTEPANPYLNYRELAPEIISYVKKMGYTHIELMPVMEHPFDASWGYQTIGYYAPTARYGSPSDFMYFMNEMHKAEIGVILDWVPGHFPRDVYGLSNFDGTCLYEHRDPRQGAHPDWGTLLYNYGRPEVSNYLIANALFWIEKYHADGIRIDAVASMLYLDYGKRDGQWVANMYGGNENLEAMEFLKHLNSMIAKRGKGAVSIAEESTAWPMVTGPLDEGGLGFSYKWNMGWMNDYLQYIKYDPYFRSYHHGELTFSMIYAYSEKFVLEFSHDEVVHGKASLIGKMPGERKDKFANLRLTFAHMMMHPGKKLLFMGQDIGEFDEWNEEREVEWDLLQYEEHQGVNQLMQDLNHFYLKQPALYELDAESEGFEWINNISADECMLVFLRKSKKKNEWLLVVENFANAEWDAHKIGVPFAGKYKEIFNTDAQIYGGSGLTNPRVKTAKQSECDDREYSITIKSAPLSVQVFSCTPETAEKPGKVGRPAKAAKTRKAAAAGTTARRPGRPPKQKV